MNRDILIHTHAVSTVHSSIKLIFFTYISLYTCHGQQWEYLIVTQLFKNPIQFYVMQ